MSGIEAMGQNRWDVVARPYVTVQKDELGEGPLWDPISAVLWWVDIIGQRVMQLEPGSGRLREWAVGAHVSAAVPCETGGLILALPDGLSCFNPATGLLTPFARPDPVAANRSNECRVDPQGRLWLGTMMNNLAPDGSSIAIDKSSGGLFRIDPDGRSTRVLSGIGIANTLAWSPDGARLYFADSLMGAIWSFRFDPDRPVLADRSIHVAADDAPGVPDGSAVDEDGCLWNARWGGSCLARFTPDGRLDRIVELPLAQPTCVAFGDADRKTLFVTSARQHLDPNGSGLDGSLLVMRVNVAGLPSPRFKA